VNEISIYMVSHSREFPTEEVITFVFMARHVCGSIVNRVILLTFLHCPHRSVGFVCHHYTLLISHLTAMQCSECGSVTVVTNVEGYHRLMPSMSCHTCQTSQCDHMWFTCNGSCLRHKIGGKRNFNSGRIYTTVKAARRHHNDCHGQSVAPLEMPMMVAADTTSHNKSVGDCTMNESNVQTNFPNSSSTLSNSVMVQCDGSSSPSSSVLILDDNSHLDVLNEADGELVSEIVDPDLFYDTAELIPVIDSLDMPGTSTVTKPSEVFKSHMVAGDGLLAASVLVTQALFQSPHLSETILPDANVRLFLYLSKLVISSGKTQQANLASVLQILYPYAEKCESSWGPMPCTVSGFTSTITNVTNSNSLVSILPIPCPETLKDGHGYTPFREVLTHALMMKKFDPRETKDPKWRSLANSNQFREILQRIPLQSPEILGPRQLGVGVIVWTDGWDTSTGTKSNRSPMHTGTITLVFVDPSSVEVVGIATYPNMGGPGKIDHGTVFSRFQDDLNNFEDTADNRIFDSVHFGGNVEIHSGILFVVQDQPERRQASGLLGGGSTLHPLFGTSCDFAALEFPFVACHECEIALHQYLAHKDWSNPPMQSGCVRCLGWSLPHLRNAAYREPETVPENIAIDTPGYSLFAGPGRLPCSLLVNGWNHCYEKYAILLEWKEKDVRTYLARLCINDATVNRFVDCSRQFVLLKDVEESPHEYTQDEIAEIQHDALANPTNYKKPQAPAMWFLAKNEAKPEGIMHLSMGIQKAIFKFIIRWASEHRRGAPLQRRLADGLCALQQLKVSYCPCRPYKDDKFGGFNAESYRAMTMISTQLYRRLEETALVPSPPRGCNPNPQKDWTKEDNTNWMYLRNVEFSSKITAPEARKQVRQLQESPIADWPPVVNTLKDPITTEEIRKLVFWMQNMFRAIFCTDLCGLEAKNRATASVMRFLSHVEFLDLKLNPKRDKPIWIAKFNFLGLLRVCESFEHFRHARNLYEGGVIGEGIVKQLRPLTATGTHTKWATNLLLKYYRQLTLDMLISASKVGEDKRKECPLGENVESCKFRRYTHFVDVEHSIANGEPLAVLLYGSNSNWKAGVIVVAKNHWYFHEITFGDGTGIVDDKYGLAYHFVDCGGNKFLLGVHNDQFNTCLEGKPEFPFWDYGLVLPDVLREDMNRRAGYRYALIRSNWQYLDRTWQWNEFE
jgi:hypothetical protein